MAPAFPLIAPGIVRTLDDLVKECREFIGLRNKSERERLEPGTPAFLLSKTWIKKYKEYIFYNDVKRNNKPTAPTEDHHPGPITNVEDICEVDPQQRNL